MPSEVLLHERTALICGVSSRRYSVSLRESALLIVLAVTVVAV